MNKQQHFINKFFKTMLIFLLAVACFTLFAVCWDKAYFQDQIKDLKETVANQTILIETHFEYAKSVDEYFTAVNNDMQKEVDKLNSMLYNANKKIESLQQEVGCQQVR